jgi:predicted nucleotidyltransferase
MSQGIPAAIRPALEAYAERLAAVFGPRVREIRLFGSHARGEASEGSDVDVLVMIDGLRDVEIGLAAGEVAEPILSSGLPLCPLVMSTERFEMLLRQERALALDIQREGIAL